jgi:hypothetical protein
MKQDTSRDKHDQRHRRCQHRQHHATARVGLDREAVLAHAAEPDRHLAAARDVLGTECRPSGRQPKPGRRGS